MTGGATRSWSATVVALLIACAIGNAAAKAVKSPDPALSAGAVYIDQIAAPADWRSDAEFWAQIDTLIPAQLWPIAVNSNVVISQPGNVASQTHSGAAQTQFILQWGTRNIAIQTVAGFGNRAEIVQISPGALITGKANAGVGNGSEFDVFGFEVDPGSSGAANSSPERGIGFPAELGGNIALQQLWGEQNASRLVQIGWSNVAEQVQLGSGNLSVIVQLGSHNRASSHQLGTQNFSLITQEGKDHVAVVKQ